MIDIPWEKVSIAPMMDITDRRFRYFMRLINPRVRLYTEMIVCHAIVRGDRNRLLAFDASEHPVTLQLGGDNPRIVAEAAKIGEDFGYDAIDLNCGCPSDRVESGNFGVCLMREPQKVASIVESVRAACTVPVSVKCRIGITGEESEAGLLNFAALVFDAGAASLTVHARTATLGGLVARGDGAGEHKEVRIAGLSPKQNREIPPLDYDIVYRVKEKFPQKSIEINGGIKTREQILSHLAQVDRVMIGRLAHEDPFFFTTGGTGLEARLSVLDAMAEYAGRFEKPDITAAKFYANMLNILHGLPGARLMRRFLCEEGRKLSPAGAMAALKDQLRGVLQPA